jgi:anti-sigma-K factor RskA
MSTRIDTPERDSIAAEQALRLLTGAEHAQARALSAADPAFAADVARWQGRLADLFEEVNSKAPPAGLWDRIARATSAPAAANENVDELGRRLKAWRAGASAMTAIAAALAIMLVVQPRSAPAPTPAAVQPRSAPMVAMLGNDDKQMKVVASWDPAARQLILAVAGDMPSAPDKSHELWVIPADGKPRSLGTMAKGKQMHMRLEDALAQLMRQGATIAISVEPPGGSPTGAPTGPVVASGSLSQA